MFSLIVYTDGTKTIHLTSDLQLWNKKSFVKVIKFNTLSEARKYRELK